MLATQTQYIQVLEDLNQLLTGSRFSKDAILHLKTEIETIELLVPVIGAFSAGKSSVLNRLLGQEVLPVGIIPETELATEIRYAAQSYIVALRQDSTIEQFDLNQMDEIKLRAAEFTHLKCYLNHPLLKSLEPLVLVDMPGFGSSLSNHNKAIAYYLPRGVFFLVLVSVEEGNLTKSMLRQLSELQSFQRDFMVLVSKANLRSEAEVQDIVTLLQDQIEDHLNKKQLVVSVGMDDSQKLLGLINQINPNEIVKSLFNHILMSHFHDLMDNINFSKSTLDKNDDNNEKNIKILQDSLKKLESDRQDMLCTFDQNHVHNIADRCISYIGISLNKNIDELVHLLSKGSQERFSSEVSEIIRTSLTEKLQEEIKTVSKLAIEDFSMIIKNININTGGSEVDMEWVGNLSARVNDSMEKISIVSSKMQDILAKKEDVNKWFKATAAVLAITTTVVAPAVELIILFLPEILGFFSKIGQEDRIRQKVQSEIFPQIKSKLRPVVLDLAADRVRELVQDIGQSFESEIAHKMKILQQLESEREQQHFDLNKAKAELQHLEDAIEQLLKTITYTKEA
jgi:GTPase Era involved in 16S rRNA processing